jgi:hypothetical protein
MHLQQETNPAVYYQLLMEAFTLLSHRLSMLQVHFNQLKPNDAQGSQLGSGHVIIKSSPAITMHFEAKHYHELLRKTASLIADVCTPGYKVLTLLSMVRPHSFFFLFSFFVSVLCPT